MASISVGPQLLTLLLCVTLACVEGEWSRLCPPTSERTAAQGVCGSNLANLVRDICRSYGYNSHTLSKRKVTSKETVEPLGQGGPFLSRSVAFSYLQKRHLVMVDGQTYKQGIVCECCVNRCGLSELREYCAPPTSVDDNKRAPVKQKSAEHDQTEQERREDEIISGDNDLPSSGEQGVMNDLKQDVLSKNESQNDQVFPGEVSEVPTTGVIEEGMDEGDRLVEDLEQLPHEDVLPYNEDSRSQNERVNVDRGLLSQLVLIKRRYFQINKNGNEDYNKGGVNVQV